VLDDFGGRIGLAWRETNFYKTDLETVIGDLLEGRYCNPVRIVAFNTASGGSRDVSEAIAQELRRLCYLQSRQVPEAIRGVVERH